MFTAKAKILDLKTQLGIKRIYLHNLWEIFSDSTQIQENFKQLK
jgi:hypothetical protein